jgi:hypothetical protein
MRELPRTFAELEPNVLIARCTECRKLVFADELCRSAMAVANCPNTEIYVLSATSQQTTAVAKPVL